MPEALTAKTLKDLIHVIRGQRVMLDADLARFYGVATKVLNQAVRRNIHRFPEDFAFQLTAEEFEALRSQFVTSNEGRGGRRLRRQLLEAPKPSPNKEREMGFHVREDAAAIKPAVPRRRKTVRYR